MTACGANGVQGTHESPSINSAVLRLLVDRKGRLARSKTEDAYIFPGDVEAGERIETLRMPVPSIDRIRKGRPCRQGCLRRAAESCHPRQSSGTARFKGSDRGARLITQCWQGRKWRPFF